MRKSYSQHAGSRELLPDVMLMDIAMQVVDGIQATKILKEFGRLNCPTQTPLTERELWILELLVEGLSNVEIAERAYISENTVKKHVRKILEKLHASNRVEAAVYAVREGMGGKTGAYK